MSSITNLEDIQIDKIETDIMSVLYANMDVKFSQFTLFNKVLEDKYDGQFSSQIHPNFKSRFLLVLRNLMEKYDDIKVSREKEVYWVVCVSESEKPIEFTNFNRWEKPIKKEIPLETKDYANMYDYIWDNNLSGHINWTDPWDGNTIYHELVFFQNKNLIEKLLLQDQFNFFVKNSNGKTPIELSTNQEITNLLIKSLLEKNIISNEKLKLIEDKNKVELNKCETRINYLESSEYKNKIVNEITLQEFITSKTKKFYQNYRLYILSSIVCLVALKFIM